MGERETLQRRLARARRALHILEEKAAGFGSIYVPAHLQIELEDKRAEIAKLESYLAQLESGQIDTLPNDLFDQDGTRDQPSELVRISQALWGFLAKNRSFIIVATALEAALAVAYLRWSGLYRIPIWVWGLAASAIIVAGWGWSTWHFPRPPRLHMISTLLATVLLIGSVGWQAWRIVDPDRFAPQVFGIAVAEFGEGADFAPTEKAREISGQVYEHLCTAIKSTLASGTDPCGSSDRASDDVALRQIGIIADAQTAQAYGARIGADVVIWGQVLTSEKGGATIHFQARETLDRAIDPNFPIILPVINRSTDIVAREINVDSDPVKLKEIVGQESTIISSFTLGLAAYLNRDFPQAVTRLETAAQAIERSPALQVSAEGQSQLYFYLGNAYYALGQIETGQMWLKRAQQTSPQEPAVPLSLALGYGSLGRGQERDDQLRQALALIEAWLRTHPDDGAATYNRAIIHQIHTEYQDAIWDYEAVIKRNPDNFYIAYIGLGQAAAELGQFAQAEGALRNAIDQANRTETNASWAHLNLALVYQKEQKPELARNEFLTALALDPKVDVIYSSYALFLDEQQELDAATQAYQTMIEVTRNKGWAYGKLATFFRKHDLPQKALESYQRSIHAQPEDALMRTYLAETYFSLNQTDNALREYEEAIKRDSQSYYVYASYANILFQVGDLERAAAMYERSLALWPTHVAVLMNLAQTYEQLGQCEKAKQLYTKILNPSNHFPDSQLDIARERLQTLGTRCH